MTSFSGPPEFINEMLGLPHERWFQTLDASRDWSALVASPVGDLAETERVFRTIWSASSDMVQSRPRTFLTFDPHGPEALATTGALRAIGATRMAEMIESGPPPEREDRDFSGMSREDAVQELEQSSASRAARRAWSNAFSEARSEVRSLLIRYLTARGVFPLEPHDPLAAVRAARDEMSMDPRERLRRMVEEDARSRLQPLPPEKK